MTIALAGALAACGTTTPAERGSIAEIASANGNFTVLLAALTEADLASTFADDGAGPFTVSPRPTPPSKRSLPSWA